MINVFAGMLFGALYTVVAYATFTSDEEEGPAGLFIIMSLLLAVFLVGMCITYWEGV